MFFQASSKSISEKVGIAIDPMGHSGLSYRRRSDELRRAKGFDRT